MTQYDDITADELAAMQLCRSGGIDPVTMVGDLAIKTLGVVQERHSCPTMLIRFTLRGPLLTARGLEVLAYLELKAERDELNALLDRAMGVMEDLNHVLPPYYKCPNHVKKDLHCHGCKLRERLSVGLIEIQEARERSTGNA